MLLVYSYIAPSYAYFDDDINIGFRLGHQIYDNNHHDPSSLGGGLFINSRWKENYFIEASLSTLGKAKSNMGHASGSIYLTDLALGYAVATHSNAVLFLKGGAGYWYATSDRKDGNKLSNFGFSPLVSVGYEYAVTKNVKARMEYQFTYGLGGSRTASTNSHFITAGISWGSGHSDSTVAKTYNLCLSNTEPNSGHRVDLATIYDCEEK